jgi:dTDP-4-dehydrorhamnose reductase
MSTARTPQDRATPLVAPSAGVYFVTGALGFIGTHLLRRLVDAGCEVVAADAARPTTSLAGVRHVHCDITRRDSVRAALAGVRPDFGVHLAAKVGDWGAASDYDAVNVAGTRHVLEELHAAGARGIVHTSSIAAMGFTPGHDAGETVLPVVDTFDAYSRTKAEGELVARDLQQAGAPVVIIRPGDVYGPGCEPWVLRPVRMMRKRQMVFVDGGRRRAVHHVSRVFHPPRRRGRRAAPAALAHEARGPPPRARERAPREAARIRPALHAHRRRVLQQGLLVQHREGAARTRAHAPRGADRGPPPHRRVVRPYGR